jgi:hypothetical protein
MALALPFQIALARTRALLRRWPPQRLIYADLVIDKLMKLQPKIARVLREDAEVRIPADEVAPAIW